MREIIKRLKSVIEEHELTELVVVSREKAYSYKELWDVIESLTTILQEQCEVETQEYIGVYMGRTADYIPSIFSIIKVNGIFVPLDIHAPMGRISYILKECNINCIVSDLKNADKLEEVFESKITYNNFCIFFNRTDRRVWEDEEKNSFLLYAIYTSGSTGLPKGVTLYEYAMLNLVEQTYKEIYVQFIERINVGVVAQYNFDLSLLQIFSAILLGHVLYITDEVQRSNGREIVSFINNCNIRVIDLTPSHIELVCMSLTNFEKIMHRVTIISSGEELKICTAKSIYNKLGDRLELINYYGPTECTVESIIYHINPIALDSMKEIPIGRPIGETRCYILNENMELVDAYEKGELYLAGKCVGKGYINRERENRESFLPDLLVGSELMYKTGDIGYYDEDGLIYYLGRNDTQVKLNGYRIELGEIENALVMLEPITRCSVIFYEGNGGKQIIAFIHEETATIDLEIRNYLLSKLPHYMIPTQFVRIDTFPMTSNGKIDKKSLIASYESMVLFKEHEKEYINVLDEEADIVFSEVIRIFRNILHIPSNVRITKSNSFLSLGGDSLGLFALICDIFEVFSVELDFSMLYVKNSVADIVKMIKEADVATEEESEGKKYEKAPVTNMERYFISEQTNQRMILYLECKLAKNIDIKRMAQAFEKVFEGQAIFSTVYIRKGQSFTKMIDASEKKRYKIYFFTDKDISSRLIYQNDLLTDATIDLEVYIGEHLIAILFDHKIMDVYSGKLVIQQAFEYYLSVKREKKNYIYYKYSYEEKKYFNSIDYENALNSILNHYMEPPEYDLDIMFEKAEHAVNTASCYFSGVVVDALMDYSSAVSCTKFAIFLEAFCESLFLHLPYQKLFIGIFNEGRYKKEHKDVIGNFAYPYPIKVERDKETNLLSNIRKILQQRYLFRGLKMQDLIMRLPTNLASLWKELFVFTINYYNFSYDYDLYGYIKEVSLSENSELIYPIKFDIQENSQKYYLKISVNKGIFPEINADVLLEEIVDILKRKVYDYMK